MIKRRALSKIFGGQVWNIGGSIFSTGEAHAAPVKQLKNALVYSSSCETYLRRSITCHMESQCYVPPDAGECTTP